MYKTKGFTLVELLVVISIIALLLSILMPALNKVREQGRTVVCATNLRNLSQATMTYCADSKDNYMYTHCWPGITDADSGKPLPSWRDYLAYYINGKKSMEFGSGVETNTKLYKAFMCPATNETQLRNAMNVLYRGSTLGTQQFASYAYNQHLGPYLGRYYGKELCYAKQADVVQPAQRMLFVDYVWNSKQGIHAANFWTIYPQAWHYIDSYRHSKGHNIIMTDGHSEYRKFKQRLWGGDLMHSYNDVQRFKGAEIDAKSPAGKFFNDRRKDIGESTVKY